jgi:DnaJ-class molecular chaperone
MEINKYLDLFNLEQNYTLNDLKHNYNNLLFKYHKSNNLDQNYYTNLNNYYQILLNHLTINPDYKLQNKDMTICNIQDIDISRQICRNQLDLNNKSNNLNNKSNNLNNNKINTPSNNINDYKINNISQDINNSIIFIDPINIEIEINFQEAYNGCSKPIIISRIINNYNTINKEIETLYVNIPNGIDNKEIITINNKGNVYNNNYGDVKIIINLLNHNYFIRNGLDIIFNKDLSLKETLLGFEFELLHINNKKYIINNKDILVNFKKIIPKFGFKRDEFYGNLIIYFKTIFPKSLNSEQKLKLNEIL